MDDAQERCQMPYTEKLGQRPQEAYRNGHDLNLWLSAAYEIVMEVTP